MKIKQLEIANLRNYVKTAIEFKHNTTVFVGDNAQGKTSILEAIHILAFTKSHRTQKDTDIIQTTAEFAKIHALINLNEHNVELDIILSKQGKKAKYNQIEMDRLSEYIGRLNVVMFSPEDLDLIKGNPKDRRNFLDVEMGQISKDYLFQLQQYKKILKQRNELLKSFQKQGKRDELLLDVITDQLIDYQLPLIQYRKTFINDIETFANEHYKTLSSSDSTLHIQYEPSFKGIDKQEYVSKYQYDIITGTTNIGIHRDEVSFHLNGTPLKTHGSQGEQRTAVLAVKLALIDFIYKQKGIYPILLLDDVLSELDQTRQNNLLQYINQNMQTIITTTNISDIRLAALHDVGLYTITQGTIEECDTDAR